MTSEEMSEMLVRVEERTRRNEGRIKCLESAQELLNGTATSVEVITAKLAAIERSVDLVAQKVNHLESLPGKRWEAVLEKAILVVVGAVLAAMLAQIGMAG
jgi:phage-related minor tail protein